MNILFFKLAQFLIILGLIFPSYDFGLGGIIKDKAAEKVLEQIPDLNLGLNDEDPITTSLDDALNEAPFLDGFEPTFLPMGDLARGADGRWLLLPGFYEITMESFCLHAGTYGPGHGDGYIFAPLKGSKAPIIRHILQNSRDHREIPQHDIQLLIWAILARTNISEMDITLQQAAGKLLTSSEITELNGYALDVVKQELWGQVYGNLPPGVRQVMEAKTAIRNALTSGGSSYGEIEQIAVLSGEAPWTKDSREVPKGRWSFDPNGYFIRYFPDGYPTTKIQVSVPDMCDVTIDASGRITHISDAWGRKLDIAYDGSSRSYSFSGKPGPDSSEVTTGNWTGPDTTAGLDKWMKEHKKEVQKICVGQKNIDNILAFGKLAYELDAINSGEAGDQALFLIKEAWQDAICVLMEPPGAITTGMLGGGGLPGLYAFSPGSIGWFSGGSGGGRTIKTFDPSGGVAAPGNRSAQRLAIGGRAKNFGNNWNEDDEGDDDAQNPEGSKPPSYNTAKDGMDKFKKGFTAAKTIAAPLVGPGAGAGMSGWAIPMALATAMIGKVTDVWHTCIDALDQDPPDPDYKKLAFPSMPIPQHVQASDIIPQGRADRFNAMMDACMRLTGELRAAVESIDKHGGAMAAGDELWITRQAEAIAHYKFQSGLYMFIAAWEIKNCTEYLRNEGFGDTEVTEETFREYQDGIRANGFSPDEQQAMQILGFTQAMIESSRSSILSADPTEMDGNFLNTLDGLASVLRDIGSDLSLVWDPAESDVTWGMDW